MSSQQKFAEIARLAALLCDGQITEAEMAALDRLLLDDPAAQAYYRQYRALDVALEWNFFDRAFRPAPAEAGSLEDSVLKDVAALQADADSVSGAEPPSHLPGEDGIQPKSAVLDFLGDVTNLGNGFTPTLWTLLALVSAVTFTLGFLVVLFLPGIHIGVDSSDVASKSPRIASPGPQTPILNPSDHPVARLTRTDGCRWWGSARPWTQGTELFSGQKLELVSGEAEIMFQCRALVKLRGPAIFEIESDKSGFLTSGSLRVLAEAPQAHGFTIHSPSSSVVDLGTEFCVSALPDGGSQVHCVRGEVEVRAGKSRSSHCLRRGETFGVEPGDSGVVVRIEPGEDTPAFKFPTIEPPSDKDYADASHGRATLHVVSGKSGGGPVDRLLDGKGQPNDDAPGQSFFFADDDIPGSAPFHGDACSNMLLMDLRRVIHVEKINTYSWHNRKYSINPKSVHVRASQKYYLFASAAAEAPATKGDLLANGWKLIARVNTDDYFLTTDMTPRPPQQAVSIRNSGKPIGECRWLLWNVCLSQTDLGSNRCQCAFYGEFDVYGR